MELFEARDVMTSPVLSVNLTESVHTLSGILTHTTHSGFPVVKYDELTRQEHVIGLITRCALINSSAIKFQLRTPEFFNYFQIRTVRAFMQ